MWSAAPQGTLADAVALQTRSYERAVVIVRAYYAVSVLWVVQSLGSWPQYARLREAHPLWPAAWWFDWVSVRTGVNLIFGAYLLTGFVVALVPERRLARGAYAFMLFQYMAFVNGFDKINANFHSWFFVSLVLILLPRGPWVAQRRAADRQLFLTVIWTAQLVMLFFYTLTGTWKVYTAVTSLIDGRLGGFNFSAFSLIVSNSLLRTNADTVLGGFFSRTELYGWALFIGTMYLESASVVIAFRPRLQRLWGIGLILFHVGTQLAMGFTFPQNVALLGLFLVASPFAPDRMRVRAVLLDLPVVHFVARRFESLRRPVATRPPPDGAPRNTVGPVLSD